MSTADDVTGSPSPSAQWSDLPDELLGMVRDRLIASPWARVRLAAVCKAWRAASSRLSASPAVPLLLVWSWVRLSEPKRLRGPDDTCVVRVPDKLENMRFVGSHDGGWVIAVKRCRLAIVNLFSGDEMTLPPICSHSLFCTPRKIIFSEDPTSNGCILASIANKRREIALCKIGGHGSRWTIEYAEDTETNKTVSDIVFCNGELYGILNPGEELVKFKINMKEDGAPVIASSSRLTIQRRHGPTYEDDPMAYVCRMVEIRGKPSMAIRTRWLPNSEPFFKVFALVHTDKAEVCKYKWGEVTSFGDQALFLGPFSSKALCVAVDQHRGLERNHIYYTKHKYVSTVELHDEAVYPVKIADNQHIFCKDDQTVGDGVERTGYYLTGINDLGMWLYPPDL